MNRAIRLTIAAGVLAGALAAALQAAYAQKAAPKAAPSIAITHTPSAAPGESIAEREITGTAANAPSGARVVVYARGDMWYVQPWADRPFTPVEGRRWHTATHGGYSFVALLVTKEYVPEAVRSSAPSVGHGVLAVATAGPGK